MGRKRHQAASNPGIKALMICAMAPWRKELCISGATFELDWVHAASDCESRWQWHKIRLKELRESAGTA